MALNARQERFAQLVALGASSLSEAYRQAGYARKNADSSASALAVIPGVASRIATLRQQAAADTASKLLISREMIVKHLAKLAKHGKSEMTQLKACELICRLQGWNEPEQQNHAHVHVQVDAGLLEQLRNGYQELKERKASASLTSAPAEAGQPALQDGPAGMPAPPEGGAASPQWSAPPTPSPAEDTNLQTQPA